MYARQESRFAGDLADLVEGAPIRTPLRVEDVVAEDFLAQALEGALCQGALFFVLFGNRLQDFVFQLIDEVIALFLGMLFGVQRIAQLRAMLLLYVGVEGVIERKGGNGNFLRL